MQRQGFEPTSVALHRPETFWRMLYQLSYRIAPRMGTCLYWSFATFWGRIESWQKGGSEIFHSSFEKIIDSGEQLKREDKCNEGPNFWKNDKSWTCYSGDNGWPLLFDDRHSIEVSMYQSIEAICCIRTRIKKVAGQWVCIVITGPIQLIFKYV